MSTLVSHSFPDASAWPFVALNGFEIITTKIIETSSGRKLPCVRWSDQIRLYSSSSLLATTTSIRGTHPSPTKRHTLRLDLGYGPKGALKLQATRAMASTTMLQAKLSRTRASTMFWHSYCSRTLDRTPRCSLTCTLKRTAVK